MAAAVKPSARKGPPRILRRAGRALGVPLLSVLIAFVAGAIIVAVTGGNPLQAYQALICGGVWVFCFLGGPSIFQLSHTPVFWTPPVIARHPGAPPLPPRPVYIRAAGPVCHRAILAPTAR